MSTLEKTQDLTALAADEVITTALTRVVEVPAPGGAGSPVRIALITLDNKRDHTRPNTLGPGGLASLDAAISTALAASPDAIAVTGKPFVFAVGADLSQIGKLTDRDTALAIGEFGQRVFRRLGTSGIPSFAFVNGAAMGGGTELALHCDYRTMASNAAFVALPEVFLGLLPGWGGTQLLPRLIGPENAVTVIIENPLNQNRMLKPKDALRLGVVDTVLDAADYLEQSLAWAAGIVAGSTSVPRTAFAGATDEDWAAALERGKVIADMRTHGAAPAPYRALEMIELSRTAPLGEGLRDEREALADLVMSQEFRAGIYAFNLVQKRARKPVGAPDPKLARPVTKVGVVGAGLMAGQIALLFARNLKVPVVLTDVDQTRLDKGLAAIGRDIEGLKGKKRITADEANRLTASITGSLDYDAFADAEFVIEAVFEELEVKKQVFATLEKHVAADAVLATNTSSLSVTAMAQDLDHPERVVGFHFFTPVAVLPMLEIMKAAKTDDVTLATAFALAKGLRKGPILTADAAGFVVNRLLLRSMGEVLAAIDEGTPADVADEALAPLGMPMSPLMLLQLSGPGVAAHVQQSLHAAFGDRFPVSQSLQRIAEAGHRTLLTWDEQGRQVLDPEVAALLVQGDRPSTAEQVRERVLLALAQEARLMLDEGVAADAADLDLGLITGAGWPFWLGGITPYLDREGYSERATGRRFAPPGVATLPA
ncbi:3-hydroxyacyl-CoA dehydrogenase NAD-binding domain-containing protein [Nakamurella multipartita]|uniref:3-hydroxyacyl-CoA dehydrogenase NAD-binding n=1 Tax=Nakamurella multipartita (strain ATCC 700099 / DSM 44233 / CIP 104796 / JCM 9543 / NBRC 105858 / Y-104) TaxID=479431 RepID=C8XEX2_NAKMY|nr:3-hydroxyacyl-CoA dehydrogenase NAD-binding domain-containing protein [Nakamurella multipartita]ACV79873.1 3-hydroxyacyl-CoA dehydrogenase NAD-binding [Nakamurella multipartita DSM 44233]